MFCTNIDLEKLDYKAPQANTRGGKNLHVSTVPGSSDWADHIRFQMSEDNTQHLQSVVWGLDQPPPPGQQDGRRTLELTVESPALLTFLENLDSKNVETAVAQTTEWFRKTLEPAAIKSKYVPLLKPPQKADARSTVKVKVKGSDEKKPTNVYVVQETGNVNEIRHCQGSMDDVTRNSKCVVIVETNGLWFMPLQFGMSLTATDILVWPNRQRKVTTGIDAFTFGTDTVLQSVTEEQKPSDAPLPTEVPMSDKSM